MRVRDIYTKDKIMGRKLFIASVALFVLALTVCFFSACNSDYPDTDYSEYTDDSECTHDPEYTVTFIADGKVIAVETFRDGDSVKEPAVPEKAGYTGSWQRYEADGGGKIVSAVYVPVEYNATFVADGMTVGATTFTVEDAGLDEPEVPKKEGYVAKWEEYELGAGDITVNAVYIPGDYTVTFIADGKVVEKVPYKTGDERVDEPAVPVKANYVGRWKDYVLGGDVAVEAVYESALSFVLTADCDSYAVRACDPGVTEVEIPERYDGLPVTAVADNAFKDCASLEKVVLPDTPVSIGSEAFAGCASLKDLNIPVNITTLGVRAFYQCTSLEDILLSGVFYLGDEAFAGCTALKRVTFGGDLKTVGNYAFSGCKKLSEAFLPDVVVEIGEGAFSGCTSLKYVELPASLAAIPDKAFKDCRALVLVTVPAGVVKIGAHAFSGCLSMEELAIYGDIADWGAYAFSDCRSLGKIYFGSGIECEVDENARVFYGSGTDGDGIVLTADGNAGLPENMFNEYEDGKTPKVTKVIFGQGTSVLSDDSNRFPFLEEVFIPDSVAAISADALRGYMSAAENVGNVAYLDGWAVDCGEPVGELCLPYDTRGVADMAFYSRAGLTAVYIPSGVTRIGERAFAGCENLTIVDIEGENTSVGAGAFSDCPALSLVSWDVAYAADFEKEDGIFSGSGVCGEGIFALFGDNVRRIPANIFYKNPYLTLVETSDSVAEVGKTAFYGCAGLIAAKVGANVSIVERDAFGGCNIAYAVIPVGATNCIDVTKLVELTITGSGKIGSETFSECELLSKVTMDDITSVGKRAFYGCSGLTTFSARKLTEVGEGAFDGCKNVAYVTAPICVFESFPENKFVEIVICGSGKIEAGQFAGNVYLKSVVISPKISEIGEGAFEGCTSLESLVIANC